MKCPNCGFEPDYSQAALLAQQEYYRRIAQAQNMNQMSVGLMQGMGTAQTMNVGPGRTFGNPACDEPPKPEPRPTAWSQFKAMMRGLIP